MDDIVFYSIILGVLACILAGLYVLKNRGGSEPERSQNRRRPALPIRDEDGQIINTNAPMGPRGRRGGPRMRRRQVQEDVPDEPIADADNLDESGDEDNEGAAAGKVPAAKMGKKKMEKMQAKADRKLEREAEQRLREERKKQMEKEDEERKKQDEKEKEAEAAREAEEQRLKEEKERREYEEYLKMKEAFSVEEEGFDEADNEEDQGNRLLAFIQYIKDNKVVLLEDLAAHFQMKTQDAIDRVTTLTEEGKLTGVIDDRGKFIFISEDEMEAVAKFITQRGRVSITELAENSNRLISLNSVS